jgi:hypothetical protein
MMPMPLCSIIRLPQSETSDLVARLEASSTRFAAHDGDTLYSQAEQIAAGLKCAVIEQALAALRDHAGELDLNAVSANIQAKRGSAGFDEQAFVGAWNWLADKLQDWREPSIQAA